MDQIEEFVKKSGLKIPTYNVSFYDSPDGADEILTRILSGEKCANTGLHNLFAAQMNLMPRVGDYTVLLDSKMQPRCITRTTRVEIVPFEDITAEYAAVEGDGNKSLAYWRESHRRSFTDACNEIGITFDEDMRCVCEYFEVIYSEK